MSDELKADARFPGALIHTSATSTREPLSGLALGYGTLATFCEALLSVQLLYRPECDDRPPRPRRE